MTLLPVELEQDPILLVRRFGSIMRQALSARPELAASMRGIFALVSSAQKQAITISMSEDRVAIERGIKSADVQVMVNFDNPASARPRLPDLCRHPLFCMQIYKLLQPVNISWDGIAAGFWETVIGYPDTPRGLRLVNSDDEQSVVLGSEPVELTLRGKGEALSNVLSGKSILVYDIISGAISARGSLKHVSAISNVSTDLLMGSAAASSEQPS